MRYPIFLIIKKKKKKKKKKNNRMNINHKKMTPL